MNTTPADLMKAYELETSLPKLEVAENPMATTDSYQLLAVWKRLRGDVDVLMLIDKLEVLARHPQFAQAFNAIKGFVGKVNEEDWQDTAGDTIYDKMHELVAFYFSPEEVALLKSIGFIDTPLHGSNRLVEYMFYYKQALDLCDTPSDLLMFLSYSDAQLEAWMPNNYRTQGKEEKAEA